MFIQLLVYKTSLIAEHNLIKFVWEGYDNLNHYCCVFVCIIEAAETMSAFWCTRVISAYYGSPICFLKLIVIR